MADQTDEQTNTEAPAVQHLEETALDRLVRVGDVDMTVRQALERAGAHEQVATMEADLRAQRQALGRDAQIGQRVRQLTEAGRVDEANALLRQMAGLPEDGEPEEDLSPLAKRKLAALEERLERAERREQAKRTDAEIEAAMAKMPLFKDPAARELAKDQVLASLIVNPNTTIERAVLTVHTKHADAARMAEQRRAEQRQQTARETRALTGAGGSPEIVPPFEKLTLKDLDKANVGATKDKLAKFINGLARAPGAPT